MACLRLTDSDATGNVCVDTVSHVTIMSQTGPIIMSCSGDQPQPQTCLQFSDSITRAVTIFCQVTVGGH